MLDKYDVVWTTQSKNSGGSMPCAGGDIGLNVWVENDELLFYIARAGCRDENGSMLKLGRVRIKLLPNPFSKDGTFRQELKIREGYVGITGNAPGKATVKIKVWVEVHRPIVHVDIASDQPVTAEATYESWRFVDIELPNDRSKHGRRAMCMINYDAYPGKVFLYKDELRPQKDLIRFHHRVDNSKDCFNFQVKQQKLEPVRAKLVNPLENLVWGIPHTCPGSGRPGRSMRNAPSAAGSMSAKLRRNLIVFVLACISTRSGSRTRGTKRCGS